MSGIRRFCELVFLFLAFTMPAVVPVRADEVEGGENIQEMKKELEQLSEEDYSDMTSEEFGRLADEYVQLLIKSRQEEGGEIATEYIENPPLSIRFEEELFSFRLPNGQVFYASVPNGIITTEPVKFIPLDSIIVTVRRDGKSVKQPLEEIYKEPGSYQVTMVGYGSTDSISEDFNIYGVEFYFRILAPCSNDINYISPPKEYAIKSISYEGEKINAPKNGFFLEKDGEYEVQFVSETYPEKEYRFRFRRDTKAPQVIFAQADVYGSAVAPVCYEVSEPLKRLSLIFNGMELSEVPYCLEQEGIYRIIVSDMAGNQSETTVEVIRNHSLLGNLWIIIIVFLILFGAGFILLNRRIKRKIL